MFTDEGLKTLDRFRSQKYPFLYVVGSNFSAKDISRFFPKGYGTEMGSGREPTRLFHISKEIPWIAAEKDHEEFEAFMENIPKLYDGVDRMVLESSPPIIAVQDFLSPEIQKEAKILVYRNPRIHNDMKMIPYRELKNGQRVVFIANDSHAVEVDGFGGYREYLEEYGYDPNMLILRNKNAPRLSGFYSIDYDYVLDITI